MDIDKVSVVIPLYNSENTIVRCIESVVMQTVPVFEIIVVDDGSTDNSVKQVSEYIINNDIKNVILLKQINSGPSVARNKGLSYASGDFIAFLDSDDWWIDTKIETQLNIFSLDSSIQLLGSRSSVSNLEKLNTNNFNVIPFQNLLFHNCFSTPTVMIRAQLLKKYSFNNNLKYSEDYDLWLRIAYENKVAICNDNLVVLGKARVGKTGLSSNVWKMQIGELLNYYNLKKDHKISFILWFIVSIYSVVKFIKRFLFYKLS